MILPPLKEQSEPQTEQKEEEGGKETLGFLGNSLTLSSSCELSRFGISGTQEQTHVTVA